jgi:hypothetical protein
MDFNQGPNHRLTLVLWALAVLAAAVIVFLIFGF